MNSDDKNRTKIKLKIDTGLFKFNKTGSLQ